VIRELPTSLRHNPFPGLRPFEPDEDYLFFGRETQVDELVRRLRTTRFLAILGTSGSGKSSLVRAGLIPSLHGGAMTRAGSSWRVAILRPGEDPIGNLAAALDAPEALGREGEADGLSGAFFATTLRASKLGLVECVLQARLPPRDNVLVLVDQFEELFRFKQNRKDAGHAEAVAFVKLLIEAARHDGIPLYIALTMRSDFIGNCMELGELPEMINEGLYLVPRLTRDELRAAITGPVAVGGASSISPRLVARLLNDVGDNPDQLPILQHALMRTWSCWEGHHARGEPVDLRHYEAIGTMGQALSQHAEEALGELDEDGRRIAEALFKALTDKGTDGRGIRRPATVGEICAVTGAGEPKVAAVADRFRLPGRSFLMPPVETALRTSSVLDLSHESLMRIWERLAAWVDEEAQSAQIYLGLARAAALHAEGKAALWRDPELQVALTWRQTAHPTRAWAERYDPGFDRAMSFLDASEEERRRESEEREAHRRSEQGQRLWRRLAWLLSAAALVTLGFGTYALVLKGRTETALSAEKQAKKTAEEQKNLAESRRIEAEASDKEARSQAATAKEKTKEAQRLQGIAKKESADAQKQRLLAEQRRLEAEEAGKVAQMQEQRAQDNAKAAQRDRDAAQRAENLAKEQRSKAEGSESEAQRLSRVALARAAALQVVRLPDNQKELAALLALRAWRLSVDNGGVPDDPTPFNALRAALDRSQPQPTWTDPRDAVRAVAVDPRGTVAFSGSDDGALRRLDLLHPGSPARDLTDFPKGIRSLALQTDGHLLAAGAADGSLRVLDARTGAVVRKLAGPGPPALALAFQPGGTGLAACRAGEIQLWKTGDPALAPVRIGGSGNCDTSLAFSPDGGVLAAGVGLGAVVCDLRKLAGPAGGGCGFACSGLAARSVAFSPDGNVLACGGREGLIALDDARNPGRSRRLLLGHRSAVSSLSFSPQGDFLASASADHTVRLWDLSPRRTDAEPIVLTGHLSWVWSVAFLPDGEQVVSAGADRTVRLWDARSSRIAGELCRTVSRPLAREEWERFFPGVPYDGGQVCPTNAARLSRTPSP
jgi:energy-coupling factor transporter ATP-binding protein EcfA2